jgi:hypothetical protein
MIFTSKPDRLWIYCQYDILSTLVYFDCDNTVLVTIVTVTQRSRILPRRIFFPTATAIMEADTYGKLLYWCPKDKAAGSNFAIFCLQRHRQNTRTPCPEPRLYIRGVKQSTYRIKLSNNCNAVRAIWTMMEVTERTCQYSIQYTYNCFKGSQLRHTVPDKGSGGLHSFQATGQLRDTPTAAVLSTVSNSPHVSSQKWSRSLSTKSLKRSIIEHFRVTFQKC